MIMIVLSSLKFTIWICYLVTCSFLFYLLYFCLLVLFPFFSSFSLFLHASSTHLIFCITCSLSLFSLFPLLFSPTILILIFELRALQICYWSSLSCYLTLSLLPSLVPAMLTSNKPCNSCNMRYNIVCLLPSLPSRHCKYFCFITMPPQIVLLQYIHHILCHIIPHSFLITPFSCNRREFIYWLCL